MRKRVTLLSHGHSPHHPPRSTRACLRRRECSCQLARLENFVRGPTRKAGPALVRLQHSQALRFSGHPTSHRVSPARRALSKMTVIATRSNLRKAIEILRLRCRRLNHFPGGPQVLSRRFPPREAIKAITAWDCPSPSPQEGPESPEVSMPRCGRGRKSKLMWRGRCVSASAVPGCERVCSQTSPVNGATTLWMEYYGRRVPRALDNTYQRR